MWSDRGERRTKVATGYFREILGIDNEHEHDGERYPSAWAVHPGRRGGLVAGAKRIRRFNAGNFAITTTRPAGVPEERRCHGACVPEGTPEFRRAISPKDIVLQSRYRVSLVVRSSLRDTPAPFAAFNAEMSKLKRRAESYRPAGRRPSGNGRRSNALSVYKS